MCKRKKADPLTQMFLKHYRMNLLSPPGNRVQAGSVYVQRNKVVMAPGELAKILEPDLQLPKPFVEKDLADLAGTWSGTIDLKAGIGLLDGFLAALGAAGLINKLRAGAERKKAQKISFRFADAERASYSPPVLAEALEGRRFRTKNALVREGNRYYVAAAVIRAASISVRTHDERDNAVTLDADVAQAAAVDASVTVSRGEDNSITYRGKKPIGFAAELYELLWDAEEEMIAFDTPQGAINLQGLTDSTKPRSIYPGDDEDDGGDAIVPLEDA